MNGLGSENKMELMTRWFLIHTKPASESVAQANLERQGYTVYYPRVSRPARIRGRWLERVGPLFPRYVFLNLYVGNQTLGPVRSTHGVANIVRFGSEYTFVPDVIVDGLRERENPETGLHGLQTCAEFEFGSKVQIVAGVFAGLDGIFQRACGDERVIVLLELLGQTAAVRLPTTFVSLRSNASTPARGLRF
jgi:transcriptional antiterminator RfaH